MKICKICKIEKPLDCFYPRGNSKVYFKSYCKECDSERAKAWREKNREQALTNSRAGELRRRYGITIQQYEELLAKQNYCCAICNRNQSVFKTRLAVDHCHSGPNAGSIRGLLCNNCNHRLIGKHTDGSLLRKMADYVESTTGLYVPENMVKPKRKSTRKKKIVKTDIGGIDVPEVGSLRRSQRRIS